MDHFITNHYHHYNAREVKKAVTAWKKFYDEGGKMFVTLGGAMSTAGIGSTLAPLIKCGMISGLSVTGANLEESYYRAVGYDQYGMIDSVSELTKQDDEDILNAGYSRVYDATIPESLMMETKKKLLPYMKKAIADGEVIAPHKLFFRLMEDENIPHENCWLYEAMKKDLFISVPGFEDSTTGNIIVGMHKKKEISSMNFLQSGLEQMASLVDWYQAETKSHPQGFFQLGGGIAGDFPICVVPLIRNDLGQEIISWKYFCQITDSTTSYGSYSGASPPEKITWNKIEKESPMFSINSDATIVAPIIFQAMLEYCQI